MADNWDVSGDWVEIAEKGDKDRLVFYRLGSDIPPARGRRQLHLASQGLALGSAPGPTDKSEPAGSGGWELEGDRLSIRMQGWEGTYQVETALQDRLILRRR